MWDAAHQYSCNSVTEYLISWKNMFVDYKYDFLIMLKVHLKIHAYWVLLMSKPKMSIPKMALNKFLENLTVSSRKE